MTCKTDRPDDFVEKKSGGIGCPKIGMPLPFIHSYASVSCKSKHFNGNALPNTTETSKNA